MDGPVKLLGNTMACSVRRLNALLRAGGIITTLFFASACTGPLKDLDGLFSFNTVGSGNDPQTIGNWQVQDSTRLSLFHSARNLLDETARYSWTSAAMPFFPEWAEFTAPKPFNLGEFSLSASPGRPQGMAKSFDLQVYGSRSWKTVLRVNDGCVSTSSPSKTWAVDPPVPAKRIRLLIHSTCGDNKHIIIRKAQFEPWRYSAKIGELFLSQADKVLPAPGVSITSSSSHPSHPVKYAVDNRPDTFWHIDPKVRAKAGLFIIPLKGERRPIRVVRARARADLPVQFFNAAYIQGSYDAASWKDIAKLQVKEPVTSSWITWNFPNDTAYRYYQLIMPSGFAGGRFYSLAEVELYAPAVISPAVTVQPDQRPPPSSAPIFGRGVFPARTTANTRHRPDMDSNTIFDNKPGSFWHVSISEKDKDVIPSLVMDTGQDATAAISAIRALPRPDQGIQFFNKALLKGSRDGKTWTPVTMISQPVAPEGSAWISWKIDAPKHLYRFWQLEFLGGFAGGKFLSLSELEVFGTISPAQR